MSEERKLYITKTWVVIIFVYYATLFLVGSFFSYDIILHAENGNNNHFIKLAIEGAVAIAVTASSIAYIRKLYKLCFKYSSDEEDADQIFLKRLGTVVYFITRPIFAVAFSLLVVAILRSAFLASSPKGVGLDVGFVYITMISSFYVGFLSGEFIKRLEDKGVGNIKKLI